MLTDFLKPPAGLSKEERILWDLERRVVEHAKDDSNEAIVAAATELQQEGMFNYGIEVFDKIRAKYSQPETPKDDGGYKKLKNLAEMWKESGNDPSATNIYGMLMLPKEDFNRLFSEEARQKVTDEYGFKGAKKQIPKDEKVINDTYMKAMLIPSEETVRETVPQEALLRSSVGLDNRVTRYLAHKEDARYIDDVMPEESMKMFHPQIVLYVAAKNGLNVLQYNDNTYQANGKRVEAQPEVLAEINKRPEKIIPVNK